MKRAGNGRVVWAEGNEEGRLPADVQSAKAGWGTVCFWGFLAVLSVLFPLVKVHVPLSPPSPSCGPQG